MAEGEDELMAKISARGCVKLAQASKIDDSESGYTVKTRLALRSDGKVLRAIDIRHDGDSQWQRGGYSIIGALTEKNGRSPVERFHRYATQRGFTPDAVR